MSSEKRIQPLCHYFASVAVLLCVLQTSILAQTEKERWRRVYTGDDSIIEVNAFSLTFEEGRILRVIFKTTLSKPESLPGKSETTYRRRLETTEFKLDGLSYRFPETTLLDSAGRIVLTHQASPDGNWRAVKDGGMMKRLFESVRNLPPLGNWKVVNVRSSVVDGGETKRLLGTKVILASDRAEVGIKSCHSPVYRSESLTNDDFNHRLGTTLQSLGIHSNRAETIVIKCETGGWRPPLSLLVKLDQGGMLMLWDGLFLELK
jgi:hypothetical protein